MGNKEIILLILLILFQNSCIMLDIVHKIQEYWHLFYKTSMTHIYIMYNNLYVQAAKVNM